MGTGHKLGFSKDVLASREWYERLSNILGGATSTAATLALCDELVAQLKIDSVLLMRFPKDAGPQLLYGQHEHRRRLNKIDDYFQGNYAVDPFYLNLETCREAGVLGLSDVIEENFDSSEYYRAHYKSSGLVDEMCFCCTDGQSGHVVLSLSRAVGKLHFNDAELEAARRIAPLMRGLMRSTWHTLAEANAEKRQPLQIQEELHRHLENARVNFGRSILTRREYDVLQLLLRGNSVELIGKKLDISVGTIKVHRKHIYSKLQIRSQSEIFSLFLDVVVATQYSPNADPLAQYRGEHE
ncbi:MAG: LuxR C-terminal-related transcriptional regulator [Pseudomonadota bacterium]